MSRVDELYELQQNSEEFAEKAGKSRDGEVRELKQEIARSESKIAERLAGTTERALRRLQKRERFRRGSVRTLVGVAATFLIFVLGVNFSVPVAYACSKVPILKELAAAVTFSRSLTDAVNNEYVQPLYLKQEKDGVTATVEYLIVDQKQVNVFFRLDSEKYAALSAEPEVRDATGEHFEGCSYGLNDWNVKNGELQSVTIDYFENDVPDGLRLKLKVQDMSFAPDGVMEEVALENSSEDFLMQEEYEEPEYLTEFDFLLEFDPAFTAAGKVIPVNETIELDGQKILITDMEIYPTHLRVNVEDVSENTAWMRGLYFYIETDWGMKFETITNGILATGDADSPMMSSYRADSSYFYEAKRLKIVITGAEWRYKDMEKVYVNLETGETESLPEGVTFLGADRRENGWVMEFKGESRELGHTHQLFQMKYYDAAGNEYFMNSMETMFGEMNAAGQVVDFVERLPLKNYEATEVWMVPNYSYVWTAEEPVEVTVQ